VIKLEPVNDELKILLMNLGIQGDKFYIDSEAFDVLFNETDLVIHIAGSQVEKLLEALRKTETAKISKQGQKEGE